MRKRRKRKPRIEKVKLKYREIVYTGTADKSTVIGIVTGKKYIFLKNEYGMPKPVKVDEKDYPGIIALKGKGCVRRVPSVVYMPKNEWDLDIAKARQGKS